MKDGKPNHAGDPEIRRQGAGRKAGAAKRRRGFVERATAMGHSGYGADSVRPHLRDQLELKALLPQPFPVPKAQRPNKDEPR